MGESMTEDVLRFDEEQLRADIDAYVDEVWEDVVADIGELVSLRSVEDLSRAAEGTPWGPDSHDALVAALGIAAKLGLDAHECEGYIGYADLPGASEKQIATIAHSDVVPEGLGWTSDPYQMIRREGCLVGRGVLDDKGPLVLSLYAAHFFRREVERQGLKLPYTLRAIIGNDEETTMGDLIWYLEHYPEPAFAFSPDGDFPLICGEKGLYSGTFHSGRVAGKRILSLEGGTVSNAVPSQATALVRANADRLPEAQHIDIEAAGTDEEGLPLARITAHGKGGHASMPEGTVNAIKLLVDYLIDQGIFAPREMPFLGMEEMLLASTDGSAIGVACSDDKFGPLTLIGGTVRTVDGCFVQTVDARFPTSITGLELTTHLAALGAQYGCSYEQDHNVPPFYMDPNMPEVDCLLRSYADYTGREAKPFTIGGGTYARHFRRACAFGPFDRSYPLPEWAGPEHGPDEAVPEDMLQRALKIYIMSIARLMALDLE
jgi:succinyl-diaminopimelate desuccinylase